MTKSIQEIYFSFKEIAYDSPERAIDFFKDNLIFFKNLQSLFDEDELYFYMELTWKYLNSCYNKGQYNDTVTGVNSSLQFINSEATRLKIGIDKNDWFNGLLFLKAMACYKLKDYNSSTALLKKLSEKDRNNDSYKEWLNYSVYGKRHSIITAINISCILLFAIKFAFESQISNYYLSQTLSCIALLGIISTSAYECYIKRSLKRTKSYH
jgi:hypothetical protein